MEIKNKFVEEDITENGKVIGKIRFNPSDSKIMYNLAKTIENLTSSLKKLNEMPVPDKVDLDTLKTADDFIKSAEDFDNIANAYELEYQTINNAIKNLEEIFGKDTIECFTKGTTDYYTLMPLLEFVMPYVKKSRDSKVQKYLGKTGNSVMS